jgi:transposase-like protein
LPLPGASDALAAEIIRSDTLHVDDTPVPVRPAAEISRLHRENDRLRTERDILKKAVAIFSEPPR